MRSGREGQRGGGARTEEVGLVVALAMEGALQALVAVCAQSLVSSVTRSCSGKGKCNAQMDEVWYPVARSIKLLR